MRPCAACGRVSRAGPAAAAREHGRAALAAARLHRDAGSAWAGARCNDVPARRFAGRPNRPPGPARRFAGRANRSPGPRSRIRARAKALPAAAKHFFEQSRDVAGVEGQGQTRRRDTAGPCAARGRDGHVRGLPQARRSPRQRRSPCRPHRAARGNGWRRNPWSTRAATRCCSTSAPRLRLTHSPRFVAEAITIASTAVGPRTRPRHGPKMCSWPQW